MRAVRIDDGAVRVVDVPLPRGDGVTVRVRSAGICGSDLHMVDASALLPIPVTLGHEIAGVAPDGTPVAVEPLSPCGTCEMCRRGEDQLCANGPGILLGVGLDGGMAEEVQVPERALVPLPTGVDPSDASLVEPLAVLVNTLRRSAVRPDQRVAVVGGGTIGLCAVAVARARGCEVGLVARHDAQREAGERLGASEVLGTYDLVLDAAGTESSLATSIDLARPGAQVGVPGMYWGDVVLPGLSLCMKQVSLCPVWLYGRHAGGRDVDAAAALLAATPELAPTLITHRFPLDAAAEAFGVARDRASGAIKVVLEP
jgi:threonine dehydrogenase-like Zn-dependent dehydrogenase